MREHAQVAAGGALFGVRLMAGHERAKSKNGLRAGQRWASAYHRKSFVQAEMLKVSNPTARQIIALLQKAGMLKEISGRKWGQLYLAAPIMKVIERVAVP